jgi:superfamily II DNA or RNA helicase
VVATITILGSEAKLTGDYPLSTVIDATSYYQTGYEHMPRYKAGTWDGRTRLFRRIKGLFPAGLTSTVADALREVGVKVRIEDQRKCPPIAPLPKDIKLHGVSFEYPYDYQLDCMEAMIKNYRGVVHVATGGGKSEIACLVAACLRLPTLFLVPGKELLYQTQKRFAKRFGISLDEIGIIGDGIWKPNQWVTVAIVASLYSGLKAGKEKVLKLLSSTQLLFVDECHRNPANSFYEVTQTCDAFFKFGLSGTPFNRSDGADIKLVAATGPVIYEVRNKFLIERGVNCKAQIRLVPIREPVLHKFTPYKDAYRAGIVNNLARTRILCNIANDLVTKENRQVVIMVQEIEHGHQFDKRLWSFKTQSFLTHQFISGKESTYVRQKAIKEFENGDLQVLVVSSILNEGVDLPCIGAIIRADGLKGTQGTIQKLGRGLRKGDHEELVVIEPVDFTHYYLLEHSQQRIKDYRNEQCFEIIEYTGSQTPAGKTG